jgi:RHS repeat-associated protein
LYFLHDDRFGTPQLATDSSQAVAWSVNYQPFGQTGNVQDSLVQPQNLRLPGQQADAESGIYHNGFRDYVPNLGRYIESDPIGIAGGMNTYAYAGANPFANTDPQGLDSQGMPTFRAFLYRMEKQQGENAPAARLAELCQQCLMMKADPIMSVFIATAVPDVGHENSRDPFRSKEEKDAIRAAAEAKKAMDAHQEKLHMDLEIARAEREGHAQFLAEQKATWTKIGNAIGYGALAVGGAALLGAAVVFSAGLAAPGAAGAAFSLSATFGAGSAAIGAAASSAAAVGSHPRRWGGRSLRPHPTDQESGHVYLQSRQR